MKVLKILRFILYHEQKMKKNTSSNTLNHIYLGYMISTYLVKQVRAIDILHVG